MTTASFAASGVRHFILLPFTLLPPPSPPTLLPFLSSLIVPFLTPHRWSNDPDSVDLSQGAGAEERAV